MPIRQYHFTIIYSRTHADAIRTFLPLTGNEWDCKADGFSNPVALQVTHRNQIKNSIKTQLKLLQGNDCAFCGLNLGSRVTHSEHIAPKGNDLYPQFMFEPKNLILACSLCNGFEKKHTFKTVVHLATVYSDCQFNIIHPYFDNPDDHLEYVPDPDNGLAYLIQVRKTGGVESSKGRQTVDLFELALPIMTEERYKDALAASQPVKPDFEKLIDDVKNGNYSI